MTSKGQLGQFYTKKAEYILQGLVQNIPQCLAVDPFAGEWDLINEVSKQSSQITWLAYDIDPKNKSTTRRDSLLYPIDYSGLWVITNPPYLAKNKCTGNKSIYWQWGVDDLYKAAIKSIIGCEGGILIVPLNFFCDDKCCDVRMEFLSHHTITGLNIFEESVFSDTDCTVCAFSFVKGGGDITEIFPTFYPSKTQSAYVLDKAHDYTIGGHKIEYMRQHRSGAKISRYTSDTDNYVSRLYLRAIDTGTDDGRIKLDIRTPIMGSSSDRTFATLVLDRELTPQQEVYVVNKFNDMLEADRLEFNSLFLTNFRNSTDSYARKRISFRLSYLYVDYILGMIND